MHKYSDSHAFSFFFMVVQIFYSKSDWGVILSDFHRKEFLRVVPFINHCAIIGLLRPKKWNSTEFEQVFGMHKIRLKVSSLPVDVCKL